MNATQDSPIKLTGTQRALRVTVLCGGPGAEREVSLDSGAAVAEALRRVGHQVHVADIAPEDLQALEHPADVIFPALHGTFGEDGALQGVLERRGLRFVGSGSVASALAMDKVASKQVAIELGMDTPVYEVATSAAPPKLAPPVVVKPVDQGSSVLTRIARDADALHDAADEVIASYGRALVERFVEGDELTVGIVDGQTLPPIRIRPSGSFYDYQAKYQDETTEYDFEQAGDAELLSRVREQSLRVFDRMDCLHLGRVDWLADGQGRLWFLEVNTLPGFTCHSLLPKAAARVGVEFDVLADALVRMAFEEDR